MIAILGTFNNIGLWLLIFQKLSQLTLFPSKCVRNLLRLRLKTFEIETDGEVTFAWEQRKLGDYLVLSRIPGHTGVDARKLTVKLWGKGVVEKADPYGGSGQTQYYIRRAGQLMYGKLDFLHGAFGVVPDKLDGYESTLDSPAFDITGIDSRFLLNRITQKDFYLNYGMIANGGRKAKRIHEDAFLRMPILVPTEQEQAQIGSFFRDLDTLITLHQRKEYCRPCSRKTVSESNRNKESAGGRCITHRSGALL